MEYNSQFILPKAVENTSERYMEQDTLMKLLGNAMGKKPSIPFPFVIEGKETSEIVSTSYNTRILEKMNQCEKEEYNLAGLILQAFIRRKNTLFVHKTLRGHSISPLPKPIKGCFQCCLRPVTLPIIDYSCYFHDADWLAASHPESIPRNELLLLLQSLQIQLCEVEKRLTNSNKVLLFSEHNV